MKNLKMLIQKSLSIFVVLFLASCEKEVAPFVLTSLPFESLAVHPQTDDFTPPIVVPVDKLDKPTNFRYLTLFDASGKNAIVIKVKSEDKSLLNTLNSETVKLIVLDKLHPGSASFEKASSTKVESRSTIKTIQIEVLETKIQKDIRLYGIKFVRPDLVSASGPYEFSFTNSNVSAVHVVGKDALKDPSRFAAKSLDCPDCEIKNLPLHLSDSKLLISFYNNKPSIITLKAISKFTDDLMILW